MKMRFMKMMCMKKIAMKKIIKLFAFILLIQPLAGYCDLLTQTLSGKGGENAIFSIAGTWYEEKQHRTLELTETREADEFLFSYTENQNVWKGLLETSYYEKRVVLHVDLSKLTLNGKPVITFELPVYLLFGAVKKGDELLISSLDQEKFRKLLGKHFYASVVEGRCSDATDICKTEIKKHFMLSPKNTKDMNKDFSNRFKTIFPIKEALRFKQKEE